MHKTGQPRPLEWIIQGITQRRLAPRTSRPSHAAQVTAVSTYILGVVGLGMATLVGGCVGAPVEAPDARNGDDTSLEGPDPTQPPPTENHQQLWVMHCQRCHGDFSSDSPLSSGNANGDFRLDPTSALNRLGEQLEAYISSSMPSDGPSDCTAHCAEALEDYLLSLIEDDAPLTCPEQTTAYGEREIKLLSSSEYQHSLEDLFGIRTNYGARVANNDGYRGGFINMVGRTLSGTTLETYIANAEMVSAWAVERGLPFPCSDTNQCAQRFVDEFLFSAFRGMVTNEQKLAYKAIFSAFPEDGLRLAIEAALTSPYFLYRIEVGVPVSTALEQGYYDHHDHERRPPLSHDNEPIEVVTANDFPSDSPGRIVNEEWGLFTNGQIRFTFDTPITDPSTLIITAKGSNHQDRWPELSVRVNNTLIGREKVDSTQLGDYAFEVSGTTGTPVIEIAFENDSGVPPYSEGLDANLFIHQVALFVATPNDSEDTPDTPATPPTEDHLLDGVDPNAYVLSPYEFASALSYRLTGSTPDATLLAAAPYLTTKTRIEEQVARLIHSERGREHMGAFVIEWFELGDLKDVSRPGNDRFSEEVASAMLQELREHFAHVFYDPEVPFSAFYDGEYSFINRTLADFYDIPGSFGDEFVLTPVERRGGPLASGAFMTVNAHANRTSPILRAVRARETALCHYIDPPNAPIAGDNIDEQRAAAQQRVAEQEAAEGTLSSRDFYYLYTDNITACAGCHEKIINPMFGMEDFDNVGRLRPLAQPDVAIETINGHEKTVSLHGTLYGVDETSDPTTINYTGAKDLSKKIAHTDAVNTCLLRRSFRFVTGWTYVDRDLDAAQQEVLTPDQRQNYGCVASEAFDAFSSENLSPKALMVHLASNPILMFRR